MFKFWKKDQSKPSPNHDMDRILLKTKAKLSHRLWSLISSKKMLDEAAQREIQAVLLSSDVGRSASEVMMKALVDEIRLDADLDSSALRQKIVLVLQKLVDSWIQPKKVFPQASDTQVTMMVGVNGAGKTTTMAKLAHMLKQDGQSVVLAAGDTFREAAIEQLQAWSEVLDVPFVSQAQGADSAAVVYDAYQTAIRKQAQWLLADTAGRLHNKTQLMQELAKVKRVLAKVNPNAPHQVLLVLDATVGQAGIDQVRSFHESIGLDGLILTKLDGTAKGGVVFGILKEFGIPIHYIGSGEDIQDLEPFDSQRFIEALFSSD